MDVRALLSSSQRLTGDMERQQERWKDLLAASTARRRICSLERVREFGEMMDEASEAQEEAMSAARRRSEERRKGEGSMDKEVDGRRDGSL